MPAQWKPIVLLILAVVAMLGVVVGLRGCGPTVDPRVEEERRQDSLRVATAQAENRRLRAVVDSVQVALRAVAAVHAKAQAGHLANANAKNARIRRLHASDSARADSLRRATDDTLPPNVGVIVIDPASSCEERYQLRTGEALDLRQALTECDQKAAAHEQRADFVYDSMSTANGRLTLALAQSDSARRREIARERPCRVDLWLVKPSCGTFGLVAFGAGVVTGVAVTR